MQGILPTAWTPQITFHSQAAAAHSTESFKLPTPPYTLSRLSLPAGPVPPGLNLPLGGDRALRPRGFTVIRADSRLFATAF